MRSFNMEKSIRIEDLAEAQAICGPADRNLKGIEQEFRVRITLRDNYFKIKGNAANIKKVSRLFEDILNSLRLKENKPTFFNSENIINNSRHLRVRGKKELLNMTFARGLHPDKTIAPKTKGQREYIEAIKKYDIVFGIGPAGTGKTYLAMAQAVEALKSQVVRRIILTRPAIEAGESLGYLPGDMYEKISPYLKPLYDALYDMIEAERIEKYLENGIIEVAPLAYMRGRTLNDAFIILDEAQNATAEQMKMFLTRTGFDSKVVITGDITQSDLPDGKPIGLLQAQEILKGIEGIKFIYFTGHDVVRHELVQKIIEAYEKINRERPH